MQQPANLIGGGQANEQSILMPFEIAVLLWYRHGLPRSNWCNIARV
jgi:hypothetical protein